MSVGGSRYRSAPSSQTQSTPPSVFKGKDRATVSPFEPCAATASLFLFAQGSTVYCLHHDTLAIEKVFTNHNQDVQFITVDNVSERGAGRLVVTYDYGQTAIVWDLFTGEQVARFASYEAIKVASWMRNGNIAFGNAKGEVILFEPSSSEHVSARTIFDPITALAPSADCKTYAIGYNNGSILLAGLTPSFTILHTLTTSRAPSPIAMLSWHSSSSKQKSDMLATQTTDGDLRVWSVGKPPSADVPRIIRVLKRSDRFLAGRNWISWSKNGRIVQFSEGETWSWDVRTKNVTYEPVQTIEHVQGITAYGPTATLFTLGPNYSVQQYDLERAQMVANVNVLSMSTAPTPFEEDTGVGNSTSEDELISPAPRANSGIHSIEVSRNSTNQYVVTHPGMGPKSNSMSPPEHAVNGYYQPEVVRFPQGAPTHTTFSVGTAPTLRDQQPNGYAPPKSVAKSVRSSASMRSKSGHKTSRLRQEVVPSPADKEAATTDLFPFIRARLSDVPYKNPRPGDETGLTSDELRMQMLSVVFGWEEDIKDLIRDEMSRHPLGSKTAAYLAKWLNDEPDHFATIISSGETTTEVDWTVVALSSISTRSNRKVAEAFVEKMLVQGDFHAAATILLALGDRNDAIEVYVSRNLYMEAILLACLAMPHDWQRQSFLVRKWGEHVVENSQQQLAIRCFSCTGVEPSEQWAGRSPMSLLASPASQFGGTFDRRSPQPPAFLGQSLPPIRNFRDAPTPIAMPAPPTPLRAALSLGQRVTAKSSALKLITSFGPNPTYKFPGLKSDEGRTPTNGTITPIAESAIARSAISPVGGSHRMGGMGSLNGILSARPGGSLHRNRLPSIGETPLDVTPPEFPVTRRPGTPGTNRQITEVREAEEPKKDEPEKASESPPALMLNSARYDPSGNTVKETPLTAVAPRTALSFEQLPDPNTPRAPETVREAEKRPRNGSRSRKPEGLSIKLRPVQRSGVEANIEDNNAQGESITRPDTAGSNASFLERQSDLTSPPTTGNSTRSMKSPSVTGRSLDKYISSLEAAQHYDHAGRSRTPRSMRHQSRDGHSENGVRRAETDAKTIPRSKRSPSSPIPMSPADLRTFTASVESFASAQSNHSMASSVHKSRGHRPESKPKEKKRHRSRSRHGRPSAPGTPVNINNRGRSRSRPGENASESPDSPVPMLPAEDRYKLDEFDPALRLVAQQRELRHHSGSQKDGGMSREASPEQRKTGRKSTNRRLSDVRPGMDRKDSISAASVGDRPSDDLAKVSATQPATDLAELPRTTYTPSVTPVPQWGDRRRKELAAAELEARRLSLARRPSVPNIPMPGQYPNNHSSTSINIERSSSEAARNSDDVNDLVWSSELHSQHSADQTTSDSGSSPTGKENKSQHRTPRAMPYPSTGQDPSVPDIPDHIETLLNKEVHRPIANGLHRSESFPIEKLGLPAEPPAGLPKHPAFDHRINPGRSSSRPRQRAFSPRALSREHDPAREPNDPLTNDETKGTRQYNSGAVQPPILPELQHLAVPPPPPPVPLHLPSGTLPHYQSNGNSSIQKLPAENEDPDSASSKLTIRTDVTQIPVSHKATNSAQSATSQGHRRERSANENNFLGKVRSMARMRSSSRGRDNATRSPNQTSDTVSPYESLPELGARVLPHTSPQIEQVAGFERVNRDNAARHANQSLETYSPYESIIPPNATVRPHMSPALG